MTAPLKPKLLVLVGPTAVGKTALSVDLCERFGGEIIGADSVQVYRGLDIGSAKASPESLRSIPHHLTDIIEPDQSIDAAKYAQLADQVIVQVASRAAVPVLVGGTGLWIRALLRGLVQLPSVDRAIRDRLEREWEALGPEIMHQRLAAVDKSSAARIHPNDRIRVVRALEVHAQCGVPVGQLRTDHAFRARRFSTLTIHVSIDRQELSERLKRRTRAMIDAGWAQEVHGLVERYGSDIRSLRSVGYRQMVEHVVHQVPLDETRRRIELATSQYARRQRTWFQSDPDVDMTLTPQQVLSVETLDRIKAFLQQ